jgi:hypothetical protein
MARELEAACTLWAHLALVYKHVEEPELDYQAVSTMLCALVFLGNNHSFDVDAALGAKGAKRSQWEESASDSSLGLPQTEVFELFARHRCKLLRWLEQHPHSRDTAMEAVVRTVTCTGPRNITGAAAKAVLHPRRWGQLRGFRGLGRYVPDTFTPPDLMQLGDGEAAAAQQPDSAALLGGLPLPAASAGTDGRARAAEARAQVDLEAWLRAMTTARSTDLEVNLQFGEFSLRKQALAPVPPAVRMMPDLLAVFGGAAGPIQSVEVSATRQRRWLRLVGQRTDLHLWQPDSRQPPLLGRRKFPSMLHAKEEWVRQALEHVGMKHLQGMALQLLADDYSDCSFAMLAGTAGGPAPTSERGSSSGNGGSGAGAGTGAGTNGGNGAAAIVISLKEVIVLRDPAVVHVYDVIERGRRWYRSLCFSSDATHCLHQLSPRRQEQRKGKLHQVMGHAARGVPPELSVVISRRLNSSLGEQTYLPPRLLYGLLPDALFELYDLWQNDDDSITGYMKPDARAASSLRTELRIRLAHAQHEHNISETAAKIAATAAWSSGGAPAQPSRASVKGGAANAVVTRVQLLENDAPEDEADSSGGPRAGGGGSAEAAAWANAAAAAAGEVDAAKPTLVLLNLLFAPPGSALRQLAHLLMRLETLSHLLAWSAAGAEVTAESACAVELLELPRINLTFRARADRAGCVRLYCEQHEGLFISNRRSDDAVALLDGVPHSLLLEREDGGLSVLVSAGCRPKRVAMAEARRDAAAADEQPGDRRVQLFPAELDLECGNEAWLANLGATRHYLYQVHVSETFLLYPNLAAALYMLLLRLLARQYEAVVDLTSLCVCDAAPSPEERQIVSMLGQANKDHHPDAHACRLHVSLCAMHTPLEALLPWDTAAELRAYVRKRDHVGIRCRLAADDELALLERVIDSPEAAEGGLTDRGGLPETPRGEAPRRGADPGTESPREGKGKFLGGRDTPTSAPSEVAPELSRRCVLLRTLCHADVSAAEASHQMSVRVPLPEPPRCFDFDAVRDRSCLDEGVIGALLSKMQTISYARPEGALVGLEAARQLDNWLRHGLELRGGRDEKGFLFLYELMRGDVLFKLHSNDNGHALGALLLRTLPPADTQKESVLMSILRILAHNPQLVRHLPKFEDDRKVKVSVMFRGQEVLTRFLETITKVMREADKAGSLKWPAHAFTTYTAPSSIHLPVSLCSYLQGSAPPDRLPAAMRSWLALRGADTCDARTLPVAGSADAVDVQAFTSTPLQAGMRLEALVVQRTREQRGLEPLPTVLPFSLSKHPAAQHELATEMLERLQQDVAHHAQEQAGARAPQLLGFCDGELQRCAGSAASTAEVLKKARVLEERLLALQRADAALLARRMGEAVAAASSLDQPPPERAGGGRTDAEARAGFALARHGDAEVALRFGELVTLLPSATAEAELAALNPFATAEKRKAALELTALALLTANRIGQVLRCLVEARELCSLVQPLGAMAPNDAAGAAFAQEFAGSASVQLARQQRTAAERAALARADLLAVSLTAQRHYVSVRPDGSAAEYDPRLLVFEFAHDLLLRSAQVALLHRFVAARRENRSLCHQLIMGQGKTTVVAPLLAIMLADRKHLVISVVPPPLMPSARAVLREKLGAVYRRPVYGMHFDRYSAVEPVLLQRLRHCARVRGVLLTDPASTKSMLLKFVEGLSALGADPNDGLGGVAEQREPELAHRLQRLLGLRRRRNRAVDRKRLGELRAETRTLAEVLGLFRSSVALLDEVDVLLHPLRSELNWPQGEKQPLSFAPMRWQLPWHLLDGALYPTSRQCTVSWHEGPEAQLVLGRITAVMAEGAAECATQAVPHPVLLSRPFYQQRLRPHLTHWALLWLRRNRVQLGSDEALVAYLDRSAGASAEGTPWSALASLLAEEQMQLLNLAHSWLSTVLPHVLSKVARVHYGLLHDAGGAAEPGGGNPCAQSRRLLAVPFVGKDVPSHAAEFSHPEALIGLTVLAYRHQGLRAFDFRGLINLLLESMEQEAGPYRERPTCRLYARWVEQAGGRVRGSFRDVSENNGDGGKFVKPEWDDLWPLQLLNPNDDEQMRLLFALLGKLPHVIGHYLEQLVFPLTMQHQRRKLSANGQDLGSSSLFGARLGFSGTPSDLLPIDFGVAQYQRGDDAQMLSVLTSPDVVAYTFAPASWTPLSLLGTIAAAQPPYHSLIDGGALITGMTNLQVARYLLARLPAHTFEGVVYLDEQDRKMILLRGSMKVLTLEGAGVSVAHRFTFFDQVHSTGVDVQQALSARAALTVGKDMTWRDYAQSAFRMRAVGAGQTITLQLTPEVCMLVRTEVASMRGVPLEQQKTLAEATQAQALKAVCAWLIIALMRAEQVQAGLLREQRLSHLLRQRALAHLLQHHAQGGADAGRHEEDAVAVFLEPLAHDIPGDVPVPPRAGDRAISQMERYAGLLRGDAAGEALMRRLHDDVLRAGASGERLALEVNHEQEEEAEEEAEEEEEKEQQQEQEQEQEKEVMSQEPAPKGFAREDEGMAAWALHCLREPPSADQSASNLINAALARGAAPFYPLDRFTVYRFGGKTRPLKWPARLWMSSNHFRSAWSFKSHRRLKNIICAMEWRPPGFRPSNLDRGGGGSASSAVPIETERVQHAFQYFDENNDGMVTAAELAALGRAVDLESVADTAAAVEDPTVPALPLAAIDASVGEQVRSSQDGPGERFWVVLSLQEAEALRGALHISRAHGGKLWADEEGGEQPLVALHSDGALLDAVRRQQTS